MASDKALLVTSGGEALTKKDVMSAIDTEIMHLYETGDIRHAVIVAKKLTEVDTVAGHAKAKLFYGISEWWKSSGQTENMADHIEHMSDGSTKAITVKRYVTAWSYVEDNVIPKEIAERPLRELVPISQTLAQGYEIGANEWRKIRLSSGSGELSEILRGIKGKKPRKSARVIKLSRDGSLYGWKDDKRYFIGYLNIKDAENDTVLSEFIEKIKISAGVIEE